MHKTSELIIILILIGFFAYLPSLFGNFVWDDEDFVYANTYVQNFQLQKFWTENAIAGRGKSSDYYRPIQFTLYALVYKIAGPNPFAFHAVAIGLHIITVIMVIIVITVITNNTTIGFLTALFFLIHPIQTESVSYISGLSDPLYVIFFLLSLYYFLKLFDNKITPAQPELKSAETGHGHPYHLSPEELREGGLKRNERTFYKFLSVGFFILSLLSKELALILPGILILFVLCKRHPLEGGDPVYNHNSGHFSMDFLNRINPPEFTPYPTRGENDKEDRRDDRKEHVNDKKTLRNDMLFIGIFIFIALLYLISRFTFFKFSDIALAWAGNPYGEHFTIRLATFFRTFFTSLGLLVFPKTLFMERDFTVPVQYSLINMWTAIFFLLNGFVLWALFFFGKKQRNFIPLFFYLCFLASLIPYIGIFLLNGIYYEHYLYLPMMFFWGSVFGLSHKLFKKLRVLKILMVIGVVLLFLRSWARQYDWMDNERFYRQTLSYAPKSVRMFNGLGMTLADKGNCQEAIQIYKQAIRIDKTIPNLFHNIANCYVSLGNNNEAEAYYLKALKTDSRFVFSYTALMNLYEQTNQKEKAQHLKETYYLLQ